MTEETTYRCSRCRTEKPKSSFSRSSVSASGRKSECKACASERTRQWRLNHPDYQDNYYQENKTRLNFTKKVGELSSLQLEKQRTVGREAYRKRRERVTNSYIASSWGVRVADVPPEMFELQRVIVQIRRHIKSLKKGHS